MSSKQGKTGRVWPLWLLVVLTTLLVGRWAWLAMSPLARASLVIVGCLAAIVGIRLLIRRSPHRVVERSARRSARHDGLASTWDVLTGTGWLSLRRRAAILRPSAANMSIWRRWVMPLRELGLRLCRVGAWWVYSSVEGVVLLVGPPRSGKTGLMATWIVDAPGAVVATSTRKDIYLHTAAARRMGPAARGRLAALIRKLLLRAVPPATGGPVHVFNPYGVGGGEVPNTVRWSPVIGCERMGVAASRAGYLLQGAPTGWADRAFWEGQAKRILAIMLHAAAIGGGGIIDVLAWISAPEATARKVLDLLNDDGAAPGAATDYRQFVDINPNTRSSITTSIMPALAWLADPDVAAVAEATPTTQFDAEAFLRRRGTLYLLAEDRPHGSISPLFTALTAHIVEIAKNIASQAPGGRLDPPLSLILDEAAIICPVPLEQWTADAGGHGIVIAIGVQSRPQLTWKWGEDGGDIIWSNAGTKLVLRGVDDEATLLGLATLSGDKQERVEAQNADGKTSGSTARRIPVMSPAAISHLQNGYALVLRAGMRPTVGQIRPVWRRRDVRARSRAFQQMFRRSHPRRPLPGPRRELVGGGRQRTSV